jgi:hypothetical protein
MEFDPNFTYMKYLLSHAFGESSPLTALATTELYMSACFRTDMSFYQVAIKNNDSSKLEYIFFSVQYDFSRFTA